MIAVLIFIKNCQSNYKYSIKCTISNLDSFGIELYLLQLNCKLIQNHFVFVSSNIKNHVECDYVDTIVIVYIVM